MRLSSEAFALRLRRAGLLIDTGVAGVFAGGSGFEAIVSGIDRAVSALGAGQQIEVVRFGPTMNRSDFERSGYLHNFPHLSATLFGFAGDQGAHRDLIDRLEHDGEWTARLMATDLVATPAACYPVYPMLARRGVLPDAGTVLDVASYCFRNEPSDDVTRWRTFRMHEFVFVGEPEAAVAFRTGWLARAEHMLESLQLPVSIVPANDPFFGRAAPLLRQQQLDDVLKLEAVIPVHTSNDGTACASFNLHRDHFCRVWGLSVRPGVIAHSACVGFGLERLALALLAEHGLSVSSWPSGVRELLLL
jgi:seryl-tRNA synthetase